MSLLLQTFQTHMWLLGKCVFSEFSFATYVGNIFNGNVVVLGFFCVCVYICYQDSKKEKSKKEKKKSKREVIEETKKSLPIYPFKKDLIEAVEKFQILIIEGETGSGKTTQIPQYLHEAVSYLYNLLQGCNEFRNFLNSGIFLKMESCPPKNNLRFYKLM